MKVVTYLYTFLSLTYALPFSTKPHLIFRSSTLENAAPLAKDDLNLFASNIGPQDGPELLEGLDITSTGTDDSAILNDPLGSSSNPPNLFDTSLSSAGIPGSTELLCLDNCQYPDSSIPLGFDPDDGNIFGTDLDSGGIFIPSDDPLGIGAGNWIEVHRGSGRGPVKNFITPEENTDERLGGSGRLIPTDENGLGNDILFSADDPVPVV